MKKYMLVFVMTLVIPAMVFGAAASSPSIHMSLLRYTPFPAEPGNYLTLTLKVENTGNADADNIRLKISPVYPFSLDSNSTVRIQNYVTPVQMDKDTVVSLGRLPSSQYTTVEYSVRVAKDVLEGSKQISIWHQETTNDIWIIETFDILVQGADRLEVANVVPPTLIPGKPTNVTFILNNSGTAFIRNLAFVWTEKDNKILPLGSGNRRYVDSLGPGESAGIPFVLVADPSATSGVYNLNANISYTIGSNISKLLSVNVGMFIGGDSEFDVSLQESQSGTVSLSIANIGSNPATSVSVSIPDQESFSVTGPSSSFVGNLNPGDFTLVSFQIIPRNRGTAVGQGALKVEIAYTDTNSNRQILQKDIQMRSLNMTFNQTGRQFTQRQTDSGLYLIIIGIAGVAIVIILIKYRAKIRAIIHKVKK